MPHGWYILGGENESGELVTSVEVIGFQSGSYSLFSDMIDYLPEGRSKLVSKSFNNNLWIFGGIIDSGPTSSTLRLNETKWIPGPEMISKRFNVKIVINENNMYIFGSSNYSEIFDGQNFKLRNVHGSGVFKDADFITTIDRNFCRQKGTLTIKNTFHRDITY